MNGKKQSNDTEKEEFKPPKPEDVFYRSMEMDEIFEISQRLEKHHIIFRSLWELGKPQFTNEIPSAAVTFNNEGETINFILNPEFWDDLSDDGKDFIVCHEMYHHILEHGIRFKEYINNRNEMQRMNVAADIVINERLVANWFNRESLDKQLQDSCWIDTVFKDVDFDVKSNESTEYYYNLLKENAPKVTLVKGFDQHNFSGEGQSEKISDFFNNALDEFSDLLDDEILDSMVQDGMSEEDIQEKTGLCRGTGTGGWSKINTQRKVKKKWESVIKKWLAKTIKETSKDEERWDRVNRRYSDLLARSRYKLPTDIELDITTSENDKIDLIFFLDTSGSCFGYKDRFIKAALSIDPRRFNVKLFSFDTRVEEVDLKNKNIYGGGGTSFNILEDKIQQLIKTKKIKKYPHSVWLITDGYGNRITPQYPNRWHWFLTPGNTTMYIDQKSYIHNLSDYE